MVSFWKWLMSPAFEVGRDENGKIIVASPRHMEESQVPYYEFDGNDEGVDVKIIITGKDARYVKDVVETALKAKGIGGK